MKPFYQILKLFVAAFIGLAPLTILAQCNTSWQGEWRITGQIIDGFETAIYKRIICDCNETRYIVYKTLNDYILLTINDVPMRFGVEESSKVFNFVKEQCSNSIEAIEIRRKEEERKAEEANRINSIVKNTIYNKFLDIRDNNLYQTIKLNGQEWMAENLRYKTMNSFCYDEIVCKTYGQEYLFDEAINACPSGWRLPTNVEWRKFNKSEPRLKLLQRGDGWDNFWTNEGCNVQFGYENGTTFELWTYGDYSKYKLSIRCVKKDNDSPPCACKVLTRDTTGLARQQPLPPGTKYPSVSICGQRWMTRNLDVDTYRNGDPIPKVTDPTAWEALTTGAYCYYNNDSTTYAATYGKLYNWYAVNDPRCLAPDGWHIPPDFETLGTCLARLDRDELVDELALIKEIGTTHWIALEDGTPGIGGVPNTGTNLTGFTALPGGVRSKDGTFSDVGCSGFWLSSTECIIANRWLKNLKFCYEPGYHYVERTKTFIEVYDKRIGCSVRCLED